MTCRLTAATAHQPGPSVELIGRWRVLHRHFLDHSCYQYIYIYHLRTHSQSLQFNQITFNVFVLLQCVLCTVFSVIVLIRPSMLTQSIVCPYSALTFYFKCPCSSPYSTHSSKSKFISGTFFMSSCRQPMCKGFSSSPKKDHFTFCGQLLVVGPTGTSRHFARNP